MKHGKDNLDRGCLRANIEPALLKTGLRFSRVVQVPFTNLVEDETLKWVLLDNAKEPVAFVVCSPSVSPTLVRRSVDRALEVVEILGPQLGRVVLKPIEQGFLDTKTFAVYPWHRSLTLSGWRWHVQRIHLAPRILGWLEQVVVSSAKSIPDELLMEKIEMPLIRMAGDNRFSDSMRQAAHQGLRRLEQGKWEPKEGIVHYDLWKGNILLHNSQPKQQKPQSRFYIIDWGAADVESFFFWDLAKLSGSFNIPSFWLRNAIRRQCDLLGWIEQDALSSLSLAVERLGHYLEYFPEKRYIETAERCCAILKKAIVVR